MCERDMRYIMYNNNFKRDGVGAQLQRIFGIYLIACKLGLKYVHVNFMTNQHNFDEEMNGRFNEVFRIPSEVLPVGVRRVRIDYLIDLGELMGDYGGDVVFEVGSVHKYVDRNVDILDNLFPVRYNFISDRVGEKIIVAVHIRRGDVQVGNAQRGRYVSLGYYLRCIEALDEILGGIEHEFHVYSEGNLRGELGCGEKILKKIIFHIDEDPLKSFIDLVNADILFAGFSSFSYSAAMLRRKGVVLYCKYWHNYSKKNILVIDSKSIYENREKILLAIK